MATTSAKVLSAEVFILRVEQQLARLEGEKAEHKDRCKAIREDIAGIYRAARDDGQDVRALKGVVKHRALGRAMRELERSSQKPSQSGNVCFKKSR
jgi:uncharacterized protein (UPF0335 family)